MKDVFLKIKSEGEVLGISPLFPGRKYVLVGFSGGADSSLLLSYFVYLKKNTADFPEIHAIHVNHMLRGAESDGDEAFCRKRCAELGVPLTVISVNIPEIMEKTGEGAEECARNARYAAFKEAAEELGGKDEVLIATAHNADDNLETVIFNLTRGGGASGLSGIPPIRDEGIIRPLLGLGGREIRNICEKEGIPFVVDSTNEDEGYTRNYIRHSVVPLLKNLNPEAAAASVRAGLSLREDESFLRGLALSAVGAYLPKKERTDSVEIPREALLSLEAPVLSRALTMALDSVTHVRMSADQIRQCRSLVTRSGTGSLSLPDSVTLEVSKALVSFSRSLGSPKEFLLHLELPTDDECRMYSCKEGGFDLYLSGRIESLPAHKENIYKLSINTALRFDTIYGKVYARTRMPGDTLHLGGQRRRLKKMICDRGIPESRRARLPVICDDEGVLMVPGLPPRGSAYARENDYDGNVLYVQYCLYWRIDNETSDT